MAETILSNAQIVLPDEVIRGSLVMRDGLIAGFDEGPCSLPQAIDLQGDHLVPGLIELHTDNIERHAMPRPGTTWPAEAAVLSHDREIAAAGITTVFNALAVGEVHIRTMRAQLLGDLCNAVEMQKEAGALKADHYLHLRCEASYPRLIGLLEPLIDRPSVRLLSLMDHTPGQRQFVSVEHYARYYQGKYGMNDEEFAAFVEERKVDQARHAGPNRRRVVELAGEHGITVASHDDATRAHVEEAIGDGVVIAEFPTTLEAAQASHEAGMAVLMGAPNLVRGQSHSGNISALDLASHGLLDIVSSDYVPSSLLFAALIMERSVDAITLPQAIAAVTRTPAARLGFTDRGSIAPGLRADLVRFRRTQAVPVIRDVWRAGEKIA